MLNFDILKKGLGIVSPPHFVYDFFKKNVSSYILLTNKFHCLLGILVNMCIAIAC